jgi:hypothetical protein
MKNSASEMDIKMHGTSSMPDSFGSNNFGVM